MLMIWSSRARNRSFDPVVLCFFGRIVPSDATQNHDPQRREIHKTKLQGLGFSSSQSLQSQMPPHPKNRLPLNRLEACSRTT
ncbi:hypothetical protein, partial [Bradyrhizobium iriomotense]|uniref:hypothetical protein n=1 Tax=Bradyrhizobium iriomotense TaxID=441950 RepID=UPI0024E16981